MNLQPIVRLLNIGLCASIIVYTVGCSGNDEPTTFDCTITDLALMDTGSTDPTGCNVNDGSITVVAGGGREPYKFALNTGSFNSSSVFNNLGPGDYTIRVKDKNGCENFVEVMLQLPGADPLTAEATVTLDTECFENNGIIEITASGGEPPYEYKFGAGVYNDETIFNDLANGNYSISVRDALNCVFVKSVSVGKGDSGTSLLTDIIPIIDANCAVVDCHNGSEQPNLSTSSNIRNNAIAIKTQTQNGNMPREGSITNEEKALIACWVDEGAKNN